MNIPDVAGENWRETLIHDHSRESRWIVPRIEHPEFSFGVSGSLEMVCPDCGATAFRCGVLVLELSRDEWCVMGCKQRMRPRLATRAPRPVTAKFCWQHRRKAAKPEGR